MPDQCQLGSTQEKAYAADLSGWARSSVLQVNQTETASAQWKCTDVPAKDRKHVAKPDDIVMKWKDADQAVGFLKTDAVSYRLCVGATCCHG